MLIHFPFTFSASPSDINFALRKIVCLLKPTKQIVHDPATGAMRLRTITTFKNFDMDFTLGKEFTEDLGPVDGRTCQVCVCVCVRARACVFYLMFFFFFLECTDTCLGLC